MVAGVPGTVKNDDRDKVSEACKEATKALGPDGTLAEIDRDLSVIEADAAAFKQLLHHLPRDWRSIRGPLEPMLEHSGHLVGDAAVVVGVIDELNSLLHGETGDAIYLGIDVVAGAAVTSKAGPGAGLVYGLVGSKRIHAIYNCWKGSGP